MNREVKIGVLVVIALVLLYAGANFLSGSGFLKEKNLYYAVYPKVDGLTQAGDVKYHGFKVGKVEGIEYLASSDQWLISFSVTEKSLPIKNKSRAVISSADILGTMVIQLDSIFAGDRLAIPGDTLIGYNRMDIREEIDVRLRPLVLKIEDLIGSVDTVINTVTLLLDEGTRNNIKRSLDKIPQAMQNILYATEITDSIVNQLERSRIQDIINNIATITDNIKENSGAFNNIINNLEIFSKDVKDADINQVLSNVSSVMNRTDKIMKKIENGEGTLGLLANDEKLYADVVNAVTSLDHLLLDLRANPKSYVNVSVFGGGSKKKKNTPVRDTAEIKRLNDPFIQRLLRDEFNKRIDSLNALNEQQRLLNQKINDKNND